jgi:paired amphipathic helix protein Sin3a
LFRLEWDGALKQLNVQLLDKGDLTDGRLSSDEDRWRYYIDTFVMSAPTEGVQLQDVRTPFLQRNLPREEDNQAFGFEDTLVVPNLEIKICANTYKIFFQNGTEDVFVQSSRRRAVDEGAHEKTASKRKERFEKWINSKGEEAAKMVVA